MNRMYLKVGNEFWYIVEPFKLSHAERGLALAMAGEYIPIRKGNVDEIKVDCTIREALASWEVLSVNKSRFVTATFKHDELLTGIFHQEYNR